MATKSGEKVECRGEKHSKSILGNLVHCMLIAVSNYIYAVAVENSYAAKTCKINSVHFGWIASFCREETGRKGGFDFDNWLKNYHRAVENNKCLALLWSWNYKIVIIARVENYFKICARLFISVQSQCSVHLNTHKPTTHICQMHHKRAGKDSTFWLSHVVPIPYINLICTNEQLELPESRNR